MEASVLLTSYQMLTVINLIIFGSAIIGFEQPHKNYILVLILISFLLNYLWYEKSVDINDFKKRWKNESKEAHKRNWVLLKIYLWSSAIAPIVLGILKSSNH